MKKIFIILLAFWLVFVTGCSINNSKISQTEIFEKKQECSKYKQDIQKAVDKSLIRDDDDEYFSYQVQLKEIFYSPIKNSCLYSVYYIQSRKSNPLDSCWTYIIQDFLADSIVGAYLEVELADIEKDGKMTNCLREKTDQVYNKALKELKGE